MSDDQLDEPALNALLEYIKSTRGLDFTGYKIGSLSRRIRKRLSAVSITKAEDYIDYLEVHPEEFGHLFDDILINVTSFFRDAESWQCIASEVIPSILENKQPEEHIRVWSAGCASGEEPFSIAMLLAEAIGMEEYSRRVKIYATDIDESALTEGRHATYSAQKLESIPAAFREKYFVLSGVNPVLSPDLRRGVIFGRHDLIQDAPISRIDLLLCRNTLMYFNAETQGRVVARFHYALKDRGCLFVGKAEMLLSPGNLFCPAFLKHRIFRKVAGASLPGGLLATTQTGEAHADARVAYPANGLALAAFDISMTPQVILDAKGRMVQANQTACTMFHLVMSDIGRPFQDLEISYRPLELRSVIEGVTRTGQAVTVNKVPRNLPEAVVQLLDVRVDPLLPAGGIVISFTDVTSVAKLQHNFERALQELETTNEELQSAQEELETTNEELQSTNEELETTNEELQSSNEELETMNEELNSTNDELEMTNRQLRSLSIDVNQDRAFLESVLATIMSAIIAVDSELEVLLWNHRAEDLWGLRADEVVGKPFSSLDVGLPIQQLVARFKTCLTEKTPFEEFRLECVNRRGQNIVAEIKITPINVDGRITTLILVIDERESSLKNKN